VYGTTWGGGTGTGGLGTVFKLTTDGSTFTLLHSFAGGSDGTYPAASLIQGADGALYGTTYQGGTGYGTVFKLNPAGGSVTLLHSFAGGSDGTYPWAGLLQGADGALYGAATYGGANGLGTVFRLTTDGSTFTLLHSFAGATTDGEGPYAGLFQGADGALYGTTYFGGTGDLGTVFKLNPDGSGFTLLHEFTGGSTDGAYPKSGLLQGADGALYGTTYSGGTGSVGTVFKLNANGSGFTLLHSFVGGVADGSSPVAGLLQGADGVLYGMTNYGGASDLGTVFKLNTNGSGFTLLHTFAGGSTDGFDSRAGLLQGSDGALYGTTSGGGASNLGTVFKLQ
jgi:uncharacterized repeat protein (TIGR03803 family)